MSEFPPRVFLTAELIWGSFDEGEQKKGDPYVQYSAFTKVEHPEKFEQSENMYVSIQEYAAAESKLKIAESALEKINKEVCAWAGTNQAERFGKIAAAALASIRAKEGR